MSEHHAGVRWTRQSTDYTYESYNRAHQIRFKDGRIELPASSAPAFRGNADRVDPEEAFVASLSSCHMLTFLAICARKRLIVDAYEDEAVGVLDHGPEKKLWMARVVLRPKVTFGEDVQVSADLLHDIHHRAHDECFIANSVKTNVTVEPQETYP
jgi:organic hydroperoxide reductase OsmC/OhrA